MGVTGLWPLLAPAKQHTTLSSLRGQTLAVDLSIWICENQGVREMQNRVLKPHLRNLFFRVSGLLQLGINLIFVIEGEAPQLKWEEMGKRLQARFKAKGVRTTDCKQKRSRSHFKVLLRECCELLDALGVPYIQSAGEAESMCAVLNEAGIVDACVSDDGDCFLYGARKVYRNLTLDTKDPHVESYSMADIQTQLGLTRERLVALALLLGCDYYPSGVPGVGEARAVKLLASLADVDILDRFMQWRKMSRDCCLDNIEAFVWQRAVAMPEFPPRKVMEEFLRPREKVPTLLPQWKRPTIRSMMRLGEKYLEWPVAYSVDKTLPLTTLWDQLDLSQDHPTSSVHLRPHRIVKKRVRQRVPCYEVEWENEGLLLEDGDKKVLVTVEEKERFEKCFPGVTATFLEQTTSASSKRNGKHRKIKKDAEALADQLESLSLRDDKSSASGLLPMPQIQTGKETDKTVSVLCESNEAVSGTSSTLSAGNLNITTRKDGLCGPCESPAREGGGLGVTFDTFGDSAAEDQDMEFVPLSQRLKERLGKVSMSVSDNKSSVNDKKASSSDKKLSVNEEQVTYSIQKQSVSDKLTTDNKTSTEKVSFSNKKVSVSDEKASVSVEKGSANDDKVSINNMKMSVSDRNCTVSDKISIQSSVGDKVLIRKGVSESSSHCSESSQKVTRIPSHLLSDWSSDEEEVGGSTDKTSVLGNTVQGEDSVTGNTAQASDSVFLIDDHSGIYTQADLETHLSLEFMKNMHDQVGILSSETDSKFDLSLRNETSSRTPHMTDHHCVTALLMSGKTSKAQSSTPLTEKSGLVCSFISDGHFTLHHTLFTSMDVSETSEHNTPNRSEDSCIFSDALEITESNFETCVQEGDCGALCNEFLQTTEQAVEFVPLSQRLKAKLTKLEKLTTKGSSIKNFPFQLLCNWSDDEDCS